MLVGLELAASVWGRTPRDIQLCILDELHLALCAQSPDTPSANKLQWSYAAETCKAWQRRCRPGLFRQLRLSTVADVHFLEEILRSPRSRWLAEHIESVDLAPQELGWNAFKFYSAWISLSMHIPLPRLSSLSFRSGCQGQTDSSPRSPMLSPISWLSTSLTTLKLTNARFPRFSTLFRAIGALPGLRQAHFSNVSWTQPCDPENPPLSAADFRSLCLINVSDSPEMWPFGWVFLHAGLRHHAVQGSSRSAPLHVLQTAGRHIVSVMSLVGVFADSVPKQATKVQFCATTDFKGTSAHPLHGSTLAQMPRYISLRMRGTRRQPWELLPGSIFSRRWNCFP